MTIYCTNCNKLMTKPTKVKKPTFEKDNKHIRAWLESHNRHILTMVS